jgi:hypothetical protein
MNEYESKLKSVANDFITSRITSGSMLLTLMFGLLSVLIGKNKIAEKDLDVIFEVDERILIKTINEYFTTNYGDSISLIQNDQELELVLSYAKEYTKHYKKQIVDASDSLRETKKSRKKDGTRNEPNTETKNADNTSSK